MIQQKQNNFIDEHLSQQICTIFSRKTTNQLISHYNIDSDICFQKTAQNEYQDLSLAAQVSFQILLTKKDENELFMSSISINQNEVSIILQQKEKIQNTQYTYDQQSIIIPLDQIITLFVCQTDCIIQQDVLIQNLFIFFYQNQNHTQIKRISLQSIQKFRYEDIIKDEVILSYLNYIVTKINYFKLNRSSILSQLTAPTEHQLILYDIYSENCDLEDISNLVLKTRQEKASVKLKILQFENQIMPILDNPSKILNTNQIKQLRLRIPTHYNMLGWYLIYTPMRDGYSYNQFLLKTKNIGPHVLVIQDQNNIVFGSFVVNSWKISQQVYGESETFLFTFKNDKSEIFHTQNSACQNNIQFCNISGISLGIDDQFGLQIDNGFVHGRTQNSLTFNNDLLTTQEDFVIENMELWAVNQEALEALIPLRRRSILE